MKIKVTIGICAKNCEGTISETIQNIINQDFPHEFVELVFVDDGSEDKTLSVIFDSVSKADFHYKVFSTKWRGLGAARNTVMNKAEGEYILWVDDGVFLPKDFVRKQVEFMEKNPTFGQANAKWGWNNKSENIVTTLENLTFLVYGTETGLRNEFTDLRGIAGSICKAEALRQVGGFDKSIRGAAEDTEVVAKIRAEGWKLGMTQVKFYYTFKGTWKEIWRQRFWYGYGGHYVSHKHRYAISVWKMFPILGAVVGLLVSFRAYELTHRKTSFLLPLHFFFTRTAWFFGFIKAHREHYGH